MIKNLRLALIRIWIFLYWMLKKTPGTKKKHFISQIFSKHFQKSPHLQPSKVVSTDNSTDTLFQRFIFHPEEQLIINKEEMCIWSISRTTKNTLTYQSKGVKKEIVKQNGVYLIHDRMQVDGRERRASATEAS